MQHRTEAIRLYGHLYSHYAQEWSKQFKGLCVYCGEYADSIDHIYPISVLSNLISACGGSDYIPQEVRGLLRYVAACSECNRWLKDNIILGVAKRREFVRNQIEKKYARYVARVRWDNEELEELSGRLKQYVLIQDAASKIVKRRIEWANHCWEPPPTAESSHVVITTIQQASEYNIASASDESVVVDELWHKCKECHKPFRSTSMSATFCSGRCGYAFYKKITVWSQDDQKRIPKTAKCICCSQRFTVKRPTQRFCSYLCESNKRSRGQHLLPIVDSSNLVKKRHCGVCNAELAKRRKWFCSNRCGYIARQKQKDKRTWAKDPSGRWISPSFC